MRITKLEIHKEAFSFSAGHFTIFSATEREQIHGHNYYVSLSLTFPLHESGLSFDYREYKKKMQALCKHLDRFLLLPKHSPYLKLEEENEYWIAHFNAKKLPFLKEDVVILPLTNITIEELSYWFLQKLLEDKKSLDQNEIEHIAIKVYNGPEQSSEALWERIKESV